MALKTHRFNLKDRVSEIRDRLDEIEDEQEQLKQRAREFKSEEGEDEPLPDDLENEWDDLNAEETELEGDEKKFIETVVVWNPGNDVVDKPPDKCDGDERSIDNLDQNEIEDLYGEVDRSETRFVVKELTFGQLQGVSDDMMEKSFDVDVERQDIEGTPKQGFYQIELLRESIKQSPAGAPMSEDDYGNPIPEPAEFPIAVGEWLFERVDALNTAGDTEMGNSSLEETISSEN